MTAGQWSLRNEIYYDNDWHSITARYLGGGGSAVKVTRGRRPDAAGINPTEVELSIDNTDGTYSPRNADSLLFGKIGINTPLRTFVLPNAIEGSLADVSDPFTRTETGTWGTSPTGGDWEGLGAGGTVSADNFDVNGTQATHHVPAALAYRFSYLEDIQVLDCTQSVTFTIPTPTGGNLEPANLLFQGITSPAVSYTMFRVAINTSSEITLTVYAPDSTVLAQEEIALTHTNNTPLRVKARKVGRQLFGKIWNPSGSEPDDWDIVATDTTLAAPRNGFTGIRSGRGSGNTNSTDPQFLYDNYELVTEVPLAVTEIPDWPSVWDKTGSDVVVQLKGAGITRRLTQGQRNKPNVSPLYRATSATNPIAYWPCETGTSTETPSAVTGGNPIRASHVDAPLEYDIEPPAGSLGGLVLPVLGDPSSGGQGWPESNSISGSITGITAASWQVSYWIKVAGTTDGTCEPLALRTTRGILYFAMDNDFLNPIVGLYVTFYKNIGAVSLFSLNDDQGTIIDGEWHYIRWVFTPGSPTDVECWVDGELSARMDSILSVDIGHPINVMMPFTIFVEQNVTAISVAHIALHNGSNTEGDIYNVGIGYAGETAAARMARLCNEANVPFSLIGNASDTAVMGSQGPGTFLDQLAECARTDGGALYEPSSHIGYQYRTRTDLLNQTSQFTLDYEAFHFSEIPFPAADDYNLRNLVIAENPDGVSATYEITDGPLSTSPPPPSGTGVGVYDETVPVNINDSALLHGVASWVAHTNNVETPRFPSIVVGLHRAPFQESQSLSDAVRAIETNGMPLTLDNLPVFAGTSSVEVMTVGVEHLIDQFEHTITANTIPADVWSNTGVWDDDTFRWDSEYSTVNTEFDAGTDTSLSVAIATDQDLWVTGSGSPQFPFNIKIAGVILAVTAISGTSSPQTFTVTQTPVNGVIKTISIGEQVRLAAPKRWAR